MPNLKQLLSELHFQNMLIDWTSALVVAALTFFILMTLRRAANRHFLKLQATERLELLELPFQILNRTTTLFLVMVALFAGSNLLILGMKTERVIASAVTIALFWQGGLWAVTAATTLLNRRRQNGMAGNRVAAGSLGFIGFVVNAVIWSMTALLMLDNLGINITALVAGLGIGGIAVALAVQNVLGDLFASLSITLDRPFGVGDLLVVGDYMGTVENIGIKSTRLRSLSGEQIIIGNSDLLGSRVRNYGRMSERRVLFSTSVTYETPIEQIGRIPALIRSIVEAEKDTRFDRSHFAKHGAAALELETVYYVLSADYNRYMDTQQAINLRLHKELMRMGVEFAYPSQKFYIEAPPDANRSMESGGAWKRGERPAA